MISLYIFNGQAAYTPWQRHGPFDENARKLQICATSGDDIHGEIARMGRRGSNSFKRNDPIRAVKSARDAGVEVTGVDVIVGAGTVTFRVLGPKAAMATAAEVVSTKEWDDEIAKLKAKKR